jgi:hypothetical protein
MKSQAGIVLNDTEKEIYSIWQKYNSTFNPPEKNTKTSSILSNLHASNQVNPHQANNFYRYVKKNNIKLHSCHYNSKI